MAADTRVAVIGIVIEKDESVGALNEILHEYAAYIIGRMGIDAPQDTISALTGKIGKLPGISVKTAYSSVVTKHEE